MQGLCPPASPPSFTAFHSVILGPKNNTPLCTPLVKILVTGLAHDADWQSQIQFISLRLSLASRLKGIVSVISSDPLASMKKFTTLLSKPLSDQ